MEISIAAEALWHIGSFPITNALVMTWFIIIFLALGSFFITRRLKSIPKGAQNVIEIVIEKLVGLVDSITQDRVQTKKFFPLVATIFIFVILSNWLELLPGLGTIGLMEVHEGKEVLVPFIRSASADLNMTLALAIISVFSVQFFGIAAIGFMKYVKKFFDFRGPIKFFVGILELISEISRLISYSFRLFGNIFAGEALLLVILFLVPYILPLPFLMLEMFVGFIQALVFAMLTLVFLKMATLEPH